MGKKVQAPPEKDARIKFAGAEKGTRTPMGFPTTPSPTVVCTGFAVRADFLKSINTSRTDLGGGRSHRLFFLKLGIAENFMRGTL